MKITEKNFLQQLQRKNPEAIEYIAETYGSLLKGVLQKNLCGCSDRWEECFNDVLLALWNNPQRFDAEKEVGFAGWLCAIAKYKAIDLLRREKHHLQVVSYEDAAGSLMGNRCESDFTDGSASLEELEKLLSCLSSEDRDLFFRRYVREESMKQITEETGLNRDTVYARISRGKKKIKKRLEQDGGEI